MSSYVFRVTLAHEEEFWHATVPELEERGATAWGESREEALENLHVILETLVEALLAEGGALPPSVLVWEGPAIAVNVSAPLPETRSSGRSRD